MEKAKLDLEAMLGNATPSCGECVHVNCCYIRITYIDKMVDMLSLLTNHHGSSRKKLEEKGFNRFAESFMATYCKHYATNEQLRNQMF